MRTSRLALAIIAVVAAILLFPFKQTIAPEWTIYTLDADRHPLANITVREVWQQYSLENEGHEEDRLTDSSGRVQFPRRNLRSSISQRLIGCFKQVMMTGVHTSCGAKSYLVAFGKGVDTIRADFSQEQGTTMPWHSTLVLQTQAPVVHQLDEIRKIECKVPKGFGCAILFASVICGVRQLSLILDGTLYTVVYGPPLKRDDTFCGLRRNVGIPARVDGENLIVRWPDGTEEKGKIIRRERIDPNRPQPA